MDGRVFQVNVSPGGVPKLPVEQARRAAGPRRRRPPPRPRPRRAASGGLPARPRGDRAGPGGRARDRAGRGRREPDDRRHRDRPAAGRDAAGDRRRAAARDLGAGEPVRRHQGLVPRGKSGRISILLHPDDSRMYARVLGEGASARAIRSGSAARGRVGRASPPSSTCSTASSARRGSRCGAPRRRRAGRPDPRPRRAGGRCRAGPPGPTSTAHSVSGRSRSCRPGPGLLSRRRDDRLGRRRGPERAAVAGAVAEGRAASTPARSRSCSRPAGARPAGLAIRPVDRPADERAWIEIFVAAFDVSRRSPRQADGRAASWRGRRASTT